MEDELKRLEAEMTRLEDEIDTMKIAAVIAPIGEEQIYKDEEARLTAERDGIKEERRQLKNKMRDG